jgi:hypothetical protein
MHHAYMYIFLEYLRFNHNHLFGNIEESEEYWIALNWILEY